MGKNTKIIVTLVPRGITRPDSRKKVKLCFSVFLSPRLPDTGTLADYYEMENWEKFYNVFNPDSVEDIKFFKTDDGKKGMLLPDFQPIKIVKEPKNSRGFSEADLRKYAKHWKDVFPSKTPVSGWMLDEARYVLAEIMNPEKLRDEITDKIEKATDAYLDDNKMPGPTQGGYDALNHENANDYIRRKYASVVALRDWVSRKPIEDVIYEIVRDREIAKGGSAFTGLGFEPSNRLTAELQRLVIKHANEYMNQLQTALDRLQTTEEITRENLKNDDFHRRFSILGNYPDLLRKLGWIRDYEVEITEKQLCELYNGLADVKNDSDICPNETHRKRNGFVLLKFKENLVENFHQEVKLLYTYTYFYLKKENGTWHFGYDYKSDAAKGVSNRIEVENGFVKPDQLEVTLFNQREMVEKIVHYQAEHSNAAGETERFRQGFELTSSGISLKIKQLATKINEQYQDAIVPIGTPQTSSDLNVGEVANDRYIIFGHHLDNGYRVDVKVDNNNGNLYSLCQRCGSLELAHGKKIPHKDESFISESAQKGSRPDTLYVDEELFRWNGWSLVCPQPGDYTGIDPDELQVSKSDLRVSNLRPESRSLPPLRFGRHYQFRLRAVDICGNSIPFGSKDSDSKCQYWVGGEVYRRVEKIEPPLVFFESKESGKYPASDKNLDTLVIRSKVIKGKLVCKEKDSRCIGPPRVTFDFAEKHGVLDVLLKKTNGREMGQIKRRLFEWAGFGLTDGPAKLPAPTKAGSPVGYLYDPVVEQYEFFEFEKGREVFLGVVSLDQRYHTTPLAGRLAKKYVRLVLKSEPKKNIAIVRHRNTVEISLPAGCEVSEDNGSGMQILAKTVSEQWVKVFLENANSSKPLKISLVHAVQKPCLTDGSDFQEKYEASEASILPQRAGDQMVRLYWCFDKFPARTTGYYNLLAESIDWIPDPTNAKGYREVYQGRMVLTNLSLLFDQEHVVAFEGDMLRHGFGDTKHRWVKYTLYAVSKFRNHFPKIKASKPGTFAVTGLLPNKDEPGRLEKRRDPVLLSGKRAGRYPTTRNVSKQCHQLNVLSTARPAKLEIDSVVPLIGYEKVGGAITLTWNTFRVYFDKDWYSSGEGEQLAVVFQTCKADVDENTQKYVSQFGADPISQTTPVGDMDQCLFEGTEESDTRELHNKQPKSYLLAPDASKKNAPVNIAVVIYNVRFSKKAQKWYADIKLKQERLDGHYFPFVKFALCRYQRHSIHDANNDPLYDCRFSEVTLTDFVPVPPKRKVEWDGVTLKYYTFQSIRETDSSNQPFANELHVFAYEPMTDPRIEDISDKEVRRLICKDIKTGVMTIDSDELGRGKILNVEEYEVYKKEDDEKAIQEENPRNNKQYRLVGQFRIENTRKARLVKK